MTDETPDTPATRVRDILQEILKDEDPMRRAHHITCILLVMSRSAEPLGDARRADLQSLRDTMTLKTIGDRVGLSPQRVDQITRGK